MVVLLAFSSLYRAEGQQSYCAVYLHHRASMCAAPLWLQPGGKMQGWWELAVECIFPEREVKITERSEVCTGGLLAVVVLRNKLAL